MGELAGASENSPQWVQWRSNRRYCYNRAATFSLLAADGLSHVIQLFAKLRCYQRATRLSLLSECVPCAPRAPRAPESVERGEHGHSLHNVGNLEGNSEGSSGSSSGRSGSSSCNRSGNGERDGKGGSGGGEIDPALLGDSTVFSTVLDVHTGLLGLQPHLTELLLGNLVVPLPPLRRAAARGLQVRGSRNMEVRVRVGVRAAGKGEQKHGG